MIDQVISHLWQSTVFAVAAGLLTLAFRRNAAAVRYWLWFAASAKFLLPFAALMSLGARFEWKAPANSTVLPAISIVVDRIAEPFAPAISWRPAPTGHTDWTIPALAVLWGLGLVAIAAVRLRAWFGIRAAVRASTRLPLGAPVDIRTSPRLLEPGVVGFLRPVLLLPEGIRDRLTAAQFEAVLSHELCHVRRRDNLLSSIHMLAEALFWFHPLVWWIGARLVEERERVCDESVLKLGNEPRTYADAIVGVCKFYAESPLVCVPGVTGANLKKRIEAIMTNRTAYRINRVQKVLLVAAGVAALAAPVAVGILLGIVEPPAILAHPPAPQAISRPTARPEPAPSPQPQTAANPAHRQVVLFLDLGSITSDEQDRARASAATWVRDTMQASDVVAVMATGASGVSVVQDFTSDRAALHAAIQKVAAQPFRPNSPGDRLAYLETAGKMLSVVEGKKALVYFEAGPLSQTSSQPDLNAAIATFQRANIASFPIDVRGLADASRVTFTGTHQLDRSAADAIAHAQRRPDDPPAITVLPGFPGGDAVFLIGPAGTPEVLSVPLALLNGDVDVAASIRTVAGATVAAMQDRTKASAEAHRATFTLRSGSYVCTVLVRERSSGQIYGETITFEVK